MSIFDRLARLFRSNVNDMISSAEQPEKMLNQIIIDMRSQLVKAKQQGFAYTTSIRAEILRTGPHRTRIHVRRFIFVAWLTCV